MTIGRARVTGHPAHKELVPIIPEHVSPGRRQTLNLPTFLSGNQLVGR
jgi:hypothetical protein